MDDGELGQSLSSFVGRKQQIHEIATLLGKSRAVTLTGVGGVGKTRLATTVAGVVRHDYPDGVRVVELAALRNGDAVVRAVARAVGIRDQSARDMRETLLDYVRDHQRMLLVLDNCEHLVDEVGELVSTLLRAVGGLRMLATSRQQLSLPGENVMAVPPLTEDESVQLLLKRAGTSAPARARRE